jgi:hypothetical protein
MSCPHDNLATLERPSFLRALFLCGLTGETGPAADAWSLRAWPWTGRLGAMVIPWPDHLNALPKPHIGQSEVGGALFRRTRSSKEWFTLTGQAEKETPRYIAGALRSQGRGTPRSSILDTTRVSQSHRYGCVGQDTGSEEVKVDWMKTSVV